MFYYDFYLQINVFNISEIQRMVIILQVIPVATFCLGTWQVRRRKWKLDLIEKLKQRTMAVPVLFPSEYVIFMLFLVT